jgi:VWFA-related protein
MEPEIEGILKLATRYDVKFYTLDSRGRYSAAFNAGNTFDASTRFSTPVPMDSRNPPTEMTSATETVDRQATIVARENTDILAQLAHDTGGLFFENNNDLAKGIARALADSRQYYVLAYVPKNEILDGKYRRITVELDGNKKFRINAKAGYWATDK